VNPPDVRVGQCQRIFLFRELLEIGLADGGGGKAGTGFLPVAKYGASPHKSGAANS
jgi:hypothetical protein